MAKLYWPGAGSVALSPALGGLTEKLIRQAGTVGSLTFTRPATLLRLVTVIVEKMERFPAPPVVPYRTVRTSVASLPSSVQSKAKSVTCAPVVGSGCGGGNVGSPGVGMGVVSPFPSGALPWTRAGRFTPFIAGPVIWRAT